MRTVPLKGGLKVLDVGCGTSKTPGAVGIDFHPLPGVDVVHDLNQLPWPLESGTFDEIKILDVIEHLDNTIKIMEEIHRLLKPGGTVYIRVVPWNHRYAFSDPTHVKFFTEISFKFFTGEWRPYYTGARFEITSFKYTYDTYARKIFRSEWLMLKLSYFLTNVIDGMHVEMRKVELPTAGPA